MNAKSEYEQIKATRVSDLVAYSTKNFDDIVRYFTLPREMTESIKNGLVAHSLILRNDRSNIPDDIAIIDYENYRSKDAQVLRDKAESEGKIPILIGQYEKIKGIIDELESDLNVYFNPNECNFEVPFFDTDETFGSIKGRLDCITKDGVVNDLKVTTQTQSLDKKIFDFGYQVQMYIYMVLSKTKESNLVFLNLDTKMISVKKLRLEHIEEECVSLLRRGAENYKKFQSYLNGDLRVIDCGEYLTPQWAYTYLMEEK